MIVEEKEKEENIRRRKIFVCGGEIRKKGGNIRRRKIFFGIGEEKWRRNRRKVLGKENVLSEKKKYKEGK